MFSLKPAPQPIYNSKVQSSIDHWCETCDKGFLNQISLQKHLTQHQKCNIDGCTFTAHPKVITKHIQMQHSTGLYSRISNLGTAEEIQKWREERKKNYPTKQNIEKKQAEIREKIERGEKIGLNNGKKRTFSGNHDQYYCKHNERSKQIYKKKPRHLHTKMKVESKVNLNIMHNECNLGLQPFDGISNIVYPESHFNDYDEEKTTTNHFSDDEEWLADQDHTTENKTILVCSVLSNLIENYKSSDEDSCKHSNETALYTHTDPKVLNHVRGNSQEFKLIERTSAGFLSNLESEKRISKVTSPRNSDHTQKEDTKFNVNDDDSGPDEMAIEKQNDKVSNISELAKKAKECRINKIRSRVQFHKKPNFQNRKMPYTLLEKLLAKDMRHERNVALQCVRYIIKNEFLSQN